MASLKLFLSVSLLLACTLSSMPPLTVARPSPKTLVGRLQSAGVMQCWDALMELRSCTGEMVLFFLNGETYLGPSCCRAIRVIQHRCWAADAMFMGLGLTAQEGDILQGYCGSSVNNSGAPPVALGPSSTAARGGSGPGKNLVN
ncbi:egg cell-secreted protein 1.3-like [Typha latifolia]|uniref:egg cell-secreted protein 1.3-like n=1 Tax=Typha latifolia TaxID=4733 RepID=UPI003C30CE5D